MAKILMMFTAAATAVAAAAAAGDVGVGVVDDTVFTVFRWQWFDHFQ